jgi:hypothetical protein
VAVANAARAAAEADPVVVAVVTLARKAAAVSVVKPPSGF